MEHFAIEAANEQPVLSIVWFFIINKSYLLTYTYLIIIITDLQKAALFCHSDNPYVWTCYIKQTYVRITVICFAKFVQYIG